MFGLDAVSLSGTGRERRMRKGISVSGTMFLDVFLGFLFFFVLTAVRKGVLMSVRVVLGGDFSWWVFEGGGACASEV